MYYILYNEKSNQGRAVKVAAKLYKKLSKKNETRLISVFDILGREKEYIAELNPEDILVIGDDTFSDIYGGRRNGMKTIRVKGVTSSDKDERERNNQYAGTGHPDPEWRVSSGSSGIIETRL